MTERDDKGSSLESPLPTTQVQSDPPDKTEELARLGLPPEVVRQLEGQPKEVISSITAVLRSSFRPPHPVYDKFEREHVSAWLDYNRAGDREEFELKKSARKYHLAYVIIGALVFMFLVWFLMPGHADLITQILQIGVSVGGGFGLGYGYRAFRERSG